MPRNVIAAISAARFPPLQGQQPAVSTHKAKPKIEVRPVPAMSASALRRMGSRRWVATLAAIPVVISVGRGDPNPVDLECRREPGGLVGRPGINPTYGEVDHEVHRFIRNLVAGHLPHLFAINEEGNRSGSRPVKGVPTFSEAFPGSRTASRALFAPSDGGSA